MPLTVFGVLKKKNKISGPNNLSYDISIWVPFLYVVLLWPYFEAFSAVMLDQRDLFNDISIVHDFVIIAIRLSKSYAC
jgi:hypothetical protein